MARRMVNFPVRPSQGGRLITNQSPESVGVGNYAVKTNWRRLDDREILREGNLLFRPNTGIPQGDQALDLYAGDILGVWECVRPNGERAIVAASRTTIYKFEHDTGTWDTIGEDFSASGRRWQGVTIDGYLVLNNGVDLPVSYRVEDSDVTPLYEMREMGIAAVGTIAVYNGFLVCGDITEIQEASMVDFMTETSPYTDAYGAVPSDITNRIRYKVAWSDYNGVTNWSPVITGTITSADKDKIVLEFPVTAFPVGAKLAVIGAGSAGGTLGGHEGFEDGVTVTDVTDATLTINTTADASLSYPLTVQVTRFADVSTFSGSSTIQDDSSAILRLVPLKRGLVVYRETGIFTGRYTAIVETPFVFTPEYHGADVPAYPDAIEEVEGEYHVYATKNRFCYFDGAGAPRLHEPLDDAGSLFFAGLDAASAEEAFAKHNPITKEIWFFCPNGVLAFDYEKRTVSWIDETYTAATFVRKPDGTASTAPSPYWFVMAKAGALLQYGMTAEDGVITWLRQGDAVTHTLRHGLVTLNDDENEKDLLSYMPLIGGNTDADAALRVKLYGGDNAAGTLTELCDVTLADPANESLIETYFRNIYFQDEVIYTHDTDVELELVGATFRFAVVQSRGVTRNFNAAA